MQKKFNAMVALPTGSSSGSTNQQWVYEDAENVFEARLAIEAIYRTKVTHGPMEATESGGSGSFADQWSSN